MEMSATSKGAVTESSLRVDGSLFSWLESLNSSRSSGKTQQTEPSSDVSTNTSTKNEGLEQNNQGYKTPAAGPWQSSMLQKFTHSKGRTSKREQTPIWGAVWAAQSLKYLSTWKQERRSCAFLLVFTRFKDQSPGPQRRFFFLFLQQKFCDGFEGFLKVTAFNLLCNSPHL